MNFIKNNRAALVLIVVLLATSIYFGYQYYLLSQDPEQAAQAEVKRLVSEVSRLVILPEGENPTIATVSDPEALQAQPFFSGSLKDDKVLIYTKAQKAILYRPSIGKIIQIAPINIGNTASSQ
jgi:hypothetical protein